MKRVHQGPDFWVPESMCFKAADECIQKYPDDAAAGCFNDSWERKYQELEGVLGIAVMALQTCKENITPVTYLEKSTIHIVTEALNGIESYTKQNLVDS